MINMINELSTDWWQYCLEYYSIMLLMISEFSADILSSTPDMDIFDSISVPKGQTIDYWLYCVVFPLIMGLFVVYALTSALLGCINGLLGLLCLCVFGRNEQQAPQYCDMGSNTTDFGSSSDQDSLFAPNQAHEMMLEQQVESLESQLSQAEKKIEILKQACEEKNLALKNEQALNGSLRAQLGFGTESIAAPVADVASVTLVSGPSADPGADCADCAWYRDAHAQSSEYITQLNEYSEGLLGQISSFTTYCEGIQSQLASANQALEEEQTLTRSLSDRLNTEQSLVPDLVSSRSDLYVDPHLPTYKPRAVDLLAAKEKYLHQQIERYHNNTLLDHLNQQLWECQSGYGA